MDSMPSSVSYIDGAFCCFLCRKTFNYEIKTTKGNLEELHNNTHIARFFNDIFSQELIRKGFYEYHRRIVEFARLQKMEDTSYVK